MKDHAPSLCSLPPTTPPISHSTICLQDEPIRSWSSADFSPIVNDGSVRLLPQEIKIPVRRV